MACEACSSKFSFFTRKKQCTDCSRYFCCECLTKRRDKILSCDSCNVLSRRPLIRSQIVRVHAKDLRRYLLAKKVSVKGCIEKEDLIKLLLVFANGISGFINIENAEDSRRPNTDSSPPNQTIEVTDDCNSESQNQTQGIGTVEIDRDGTEEICGINLSPNGRSEPVISEEGEISEISNLQCSNVFTEVPTWSNLVKLSDINTSSELERLSVKQLKNLLSTNRVDYKGCIERSELLNRVSRLWEQHKQSRTDVETPDEDLCKVCWDKPIECVILECGHMACCLNCGKQMSECPICKQYVIRVVRVFKA